MCRLLPVSEVEQVVGVDGLTPHKNDSLDLSSCRYATSDVNVRIILDGAADATRRYYNQLGPAMPMMPVMTRRDGRLSGVHGTMGGHAQPQIQLQLLQRLLDGARAVSRFPRRRAGKPHRVSESNGTSGTSLSLTTGGITLLGVLLSIGVTVGFGVHADWWIKVLVGAATTVLLGVVVKLGSSSGRGPLARMANWMIEDIDPDQR